MEWPLTVFFFAMAGGLLWEASKATRSRAQVKLWVALFSAVGVVTVLLRSIGADYSWTRRLAGIAVALAWLTCLAVYLRNRQEARQPPG